MTAVVSEPTLQALADRLRDAQERRTPCEPLTAEFPDLTLAEAYRIAGRNVARLGAPIVGRKIGLTSAAVQRQLGVDQPDFGALVAGMEVPEGGEADFSRLLQPRVEGEIAFVLGRDLQGPGVTAAQVLAATDFVLPAIEVADCRIADWRIKVQDTVADNAAAAMYVLGSRPASPRDLDMRLAGLALRINGEVATTGAGAACLGNPVNAVAWLANTLGALGTPLSAGEVVLAGAMCPLVAVLPGDCVEVAISGLGSVAVRFSEA
ncbi:MAG: fumarylacetoacetate hydrolase family protein [Candidatus Sericytochromatia bacterium]|nr:fumarylacetoacetate hydrolase family protein [Candidatus Tanganyikabacteria bacterium]